MEAEVMSPDPHIRKRVVILGGGTAGWITANAMMHSWADKKIDIILIESPAIGTVGVGEGSTPRLKLFFESIGVQESESSAVVFCDRRAFSTTFCSLGASRGFAVFSSTMPTTPPSSREALGDL